MPIGMPTTQMNITAANASAIVGTRFCAITSDTGRLNSNEKPKSPVRMRVIHFQYWT